MTDTPQRRITDAPGAPERLILLEDRLSNVKDAVSGVAEALKQHVDEETTLIREIFVANQKTADDIGTIKHGQVNINSALDKLIEQGARIHVVESKVVINDAFAAKTEARLDDHDKRHAVTEEQVKRILMGAGFVGSGLLVVIGWALQHFHII
jgi:hypothetical protein